MITKAVRWMFVIIIYYCHTGSAIYLNFSGQGWVSDSLIIVTCLHFRGIQYRYIVARTALITAVFLCSNRGVIQVVLKIVVI